MESTAFVPLSRWLLSGGLAIAGLAALFRYILVSLLRQTFIPRFSHSTAHTLAQRFQELQRHREQLTQRRFAVEHRKILETRVEERMRLDDILADIARDIEQIEESLRDIEGHPDFQPAALKQQTEPESKAAQQRQTRLRKAAQWCRVLLIGGLFLALTGGGGLMVSRQNTGDAIRTVEVAVERLADDIGKEVYEVFETIDSYGELAALEVSQKAPKLGQQLIAIDPDDHLLSLGHQIMKYEAAVWVFYMAASVETREHEKREYAEQGILFGERARTRIRDARENAASGEEQAQQLVGWIDGNLREERVIHHLALCFAIQAQLGDDEAPEQVNALIEELPASYQKRYPLYRDRELQWFLEQEQFR